MNLFTDNWMRVGYVLACVALPVVWGVFVNWAFAAWRSKDRDTPDPDENDYVWPDYQI